MIRIQSLRAGSRDAIGVLVMRILRKFLRGLERSRQRRALAMLSEERLRDLGLTRREVEHESAKSGWRG